MEYSDSMYVMRCAWCWCDSCYERKPKHRHADEGLRTTSASKRGSSEAESLRSCSRKECDRALAACRWLVQRSRRDVTLGDLLQI